MKAPETIQTAVIIKFRSENNVSAGNIDTVLAITIPNTMCETTEYHLLYNFFTALGNTIKQIAIPINKGSKTETENFAIPSNMGWYKPKNKSKVEELKPGTIKLIPQTIPQKRKLGSIPNSV